MDTKQLIEYLALDEKSAEVLLDEINPRLKSRFKRACSNLAKIVDEVREVYPDASIYLSNEIPSLILGEPFSGGKPWNYYQDSNHQAVACESRILLGKIDCGEW